MSESQSCLKCAKLANVYILGVPACFEHQKEVEELMLKRTPAKSGKSDISVNHDKYLYNKP